MDKKNCRNCKLFIRIREPMKIRPRGFCINGQNDGSFGLYVSSSVANKCPTYINGNNHILKLEDELWDESNKIGHRYVDRVLERKYELEEIFEARKEAHNEFLRVYRNGLTKLESYCNSTREGHETIMRSFAYDMREMTKVMNNDD